MDPVARLTSSENYFTDPQQWNAYAYARNNPVKLSDPTGKEANNPINKNLIKDLINNVKNILNKLISDRSVKNEQTHTQDTQTSLKDKESIRTTTWDPITDKRILQLDTRVQQPATNFINDTESELDIQLRVVHGYRSIEEQNKLYAQGRTEPGNKVTYARGGESYHNYGLAIDVVRMEDGKANWNKPITQDIADIGIKQGFSWGGSWSSFKDYPHFEMTFGQSIKTLICSNNKKL